MARLDDTAIETALRDLPDWRRDGHTIVRQLKRRDWRDAIALVDAVAAEADKRDHHPDVCVTGYRTVTFTLTSHSDGGITSRDLAMAAEIDRLAAG
ncbi:MAG: 4a-hydroxytetrahydrobiopterin dehydratase [Chloroflexota bacterium]